MKVFEYQLINAGDMSDDITSGSQQMTFMLVACLQAFYTGAPVGTLTIEISNDNVNFSTLGTPTAISAAGSTAFHLADIGYPWIRVLYTSTSGTGSLSVTINGKGV